MQRKKKVLCFHVKLFAFLRQNKIATSFSDDNMDAKLVIIDYEYCSYNYRAFDFANHFHEWMFDYTNKSYPFYYVDKDKFPTKEQRVSEYMCKIQTCI